MTHRWSLRETDLWNYSLSLQEIDKMRVDGKFVDSEGNRPSGQYVSTLQSIRKYMLTVLSRCCCIYSGDVMVSSIVCFPQASQFQKNSCPLFVHHLSRTCFPYLLSSIQANKLTTVKKCLNEVLKYGGTFNARDLYPVRFFYIPCITSSVLTLVHSFISIN